MASKYYDYTHITGPPRRYARLPDTPQPTLVRHPSPREQPGGGGGGDDGGHCQLD